jgi:hypothetical protein
VAESAHPAHLERLDLPFAEHAWVLRYDYLVSGSLGLAYPKQLQVVVSGLGVYRRPAPCMLIELYAISEHTRGRTWDTYRC